MSFEQIGLYEVESPYCPFKDYIDYDDRHCLDLGMGSAGYKVIGEDSLDIDKWIAEVRGVDIQDICARNIPIPNLPSYIPTITSGSKKLFAKHRPPMVAVKLGDVVSTERLKVAESLEKRFGIPTGTPVLLQCYGKDRLLENIWPQRYKIFPKLANLGFCAITGLNYSVWHSHPHAERLINIKRAHLTFEDWQNLGIPAIPHMYWCSKANLKAWIQWIDNNPAVRVMAIDMQTMRTKYDWEYALTGLRYFVGKLKRPLHFLITGPSQPLRIAQIKQILPSLSITNGLSARKAFASHLITANGTKMSGDYSKLDKSTIFYKNNQAYENMIKLINKPSLPSFSPHLMSYKPVALAKII